MTVYFILAEEVQRVKIGYTEATALARLKSLQVGSPCKLKIVFEILNAASGVEKEFHNRFNHLRLHGEWFRYSDELRAFLDSVNSTNTQLIHAGANYTRKKPDKNQRHATQLPKFERVQDRVDIIPRYQFVLDAALNQARKNYPFILKITPEGVVFGQKGNRG